MSCLCSSQGDAELLTDLDSVLLARPVYHLDNWEDIKEEMMVSNVLQRDNVVFAKKLHPQLETEARISDQNAKADKLWTAVARREVVESLLDSWLDHSQEDATLEVLLTALSAPDFKDIKMRIESLVLLP